jgi:hypothetical protein
MAWPTEYPTGRYTARISAPGFHGIERELIFDQHEFSLRTQLDVSQECANYYGGVYGSIRPAPGNRELWVKLVPVNGSGGGETRVSRTGAFQLRGLEHGDYLVLVLAGKSVIHTGSVQADGGINVNIDLGQR